MFERRECRGFLSGLRFWPRPAFLGEVKRNQTKDQDDQTAWDDAIHATTPWWSEETVNPL